MIRIMALITTGIFYFGCSSGVVYKNVYIPQKCQTTIPDEIVCNANKDDYKAIFSCMVENYKRALIIEKRLKYCIGE